MTENGKTQDQNAANIHDSGDVALMIDGLYNWLTYDLKKLKEEILKEVKASTAQTGTACQEIKADTASAAADTQKKVENVLRELKYGYQQNQAIYEDICQVMDETVAQKLDGIQAGEGVDADALAEAVREKVVESFPMYDELDYDKMAETVAEKTEASVAEHSQKVLDAVAAIPLAENVDYTRIVEEVGDRVLEIINDVKAVNADGTPAVAAAEIDYDKVIYGTAEKVVESLPYAEKIDYDRIAQNGSGIDETLLSAVVSAAVAKAMSNLDYDKLAEAVVARMPAQEIDYGVLAEMVVAKIEETGAAPYEIVIDREGVQQIADHIAGRLDSEVIADRVADKITPAKEDDQQDQILDLVIDEESVQAIAKAVSENITLQCVRAQETVAEEPVEEVVEELVAEEPVEEVVEETVAEEPVEEVVEEPVAEEPVEEVVEEPVAEVVEEVAPAAVQEIAEDGNELIDAETGLVIRLKRSFTAKMKQSEDNVKEYYSRIKNALKGYKKVNSNISWHGDRFNFGRETIAKMNICGKTLCLYLALDPNDEQFKTSVYHQKDVSSQKAYEGTPFMVKVRSDGAVKKALRLVAALAEKFTCESDETFAEVNYADEFTFQTTKELLAEGLIKQTKEKKVALNF